MESSSSLNLNEQYPDPPETDNLSIALFGPDEDHRRAAVEVLTACRAGKISEFSSYPASLEDVPKLLEQHFDVILIDLDSHSDYALELVENICANSTATVMVYSAKLESDVLVRCMRAGVREFLTLPFTQDTITEAVVRATARRLAISSVKKSAGRLLVFLGAKGGDGVTTLSCNFAVSMARESGQSTLLIDLDLPLGDAALNLGVVAEYSTINALQNAARLDSSFLSKLLVKHSSGVTVLAAPGKFPNYEAHDEAIDKLIAVAQQEFDNVVVDIGSRLDLMGTSLFKAGSTVYLVIQAGIAGLRNSNRLITQYFASEVPKLEIVINRFDPRSLGIPENEITKALTRPAKWKIPNDFAAVQRMQHRATPLALEDSPISRLMKKMARSACGLPPAPEKKTGLTLKSLGQRISTRIYNSDRSPSNARTAVQAGEWDDNGVHGALEMIAGQPVDSVDVDRSAAAESQVHFTPVNRAIRLDLTEKPEEANHSGSAQQQLGEAETLIYNGASYVKGGDNQWHLQHIDAGAVETKTPAVTWPEPAPIAYGTALSAQQLNATASVPGNYVYTPASGEKLTAGTHSLSLTFVPADAASYSTTHASVSLVVTKTVPTIEWPKPDPIAYGAALSATQLNAIASVPGSFLYFPAEGEVLTAGERTLSVTFTPLNVAGFKTAVAAVSLTVKKTTPAITSTASAPAVDLPARSASQAKSALQPAVSPAAQDQADKPPNQENSALRKATAKALVKALSTNSAVDLGSGLHLMSSAVFKDGTSVYLVMEPGDAGLSDSSRLITQFFINGDPKPEIVINRPEPGFQSASGGQISTVLARLTSPFARLAQRIARIVSGQRTSRDNGTGNPLKALGQSAWSKSFTTEKAPAIVPAGLTTGKDEALEIHAAIPTIEQGFPEVKKSASAHPLQEKAHSKQPKGKKASTPVKKTASKSKQSPRKAKSRTNAKQTVHPVRKANKKSKTQASTSRSAPKKK